MVWNVLALVAILAFIGLLFWLMADPAWPTGPTEDQP